MTVSFSKTFGSSVLLWFRRDLERDAVRAHWRGPHAQLVARTPGFRDYRQHHFAMASHGFWPAVPGVETAIPPERRVDGMPEVVFDGLTAPLRGRRRQKLVQADEANAFARTVLYVCAPRSGRIYDLASRGSVTTRSVVLLRRRGGVGGRAFATFVRDRLALALADEPLLRELRLQVFMPWNPAHWNTPGVAHDNPPDARFHASFVLGFADVADRQAFFASPAIAAMAAHIGARCDAVHAYAVEATHIYVKDGRVTLSQTAPQPAPPIEPARRALPPPPPRAAHIESAAPFPPARLIKLPGAGAEDVVADAEGRLIYGLGDGRIVRMQPQDGTEDIIGDTGGRPLGLEMLDDGQILICDARRGLLRLDPSSGDVETLVDAVDDVPLRFCSNVVAGADGTYWFTESTSRFDFEHYLGAMVEHRPSGRLFQRDPDGKVSVVLDQLHFANGLALVDDGAALVFAETDGYRLSRLELRGPNVGRLAVIADNLAGFPDNISACAYGRFWVAMVARRNAMLEKAGRWPAWIRRLAWTRMNLAPPTRGTTWVMAFDARGNVIADFQTERMDFFGATGVVEVQGRLYLAGVDAQGLLEIELP